MFMGTHSVHLLWRWRQRQIDCLECSHRSRQIGSRVISPAFFSQSASFVSVCQHPTTQLGCALPDDLNHASPCVLSSSLLSS